MSYPSRIIRRRPSAGGAALGGGLHPLLQRIYAARGIGAAAEVVHSLDALLPVTSLAGVTEAVELLRRHREGHVLIVGDFDADGATGSALLVRGLRALGFARVDYLVPDRFTLGYGLTPGIVALAAAREPTLIVTVDNGISSLEGVAAARALGIPVLITDHHLPGAMLPEAEVIVNPNLADSRFASRALCGVGVAFYVIAALARTLDAGDFRAASLLDLVALGTVADLVPLDRNNRILVAQGLKRIRAGRCVPGIRSLAAAAGRRLEQLEVSDLGFALAPRVNAAGRLTDMSVGIACLVSEDPAETLRLALELDALNRERREIEQRMQREARVLAERARVEAEGRDAPGVCLFDPDWHVGVVGLVAGRIKERLHRPVIAFACADESTLRGSARSVEGLHIRDVLEDIASRHPGLLGRFGGHAMAAGLSLERSRLEEFRHAFAAAVAARIDESLLAGTLESDGALEPGDLSLDTARVLRAGGPWGSGFPEPLFDGVFQIAEQRVVGDRHLKLRVRPCADGGAPHATAPLDAIAFGFVESAQDLEPLRPGARVELGYRLEVNEYDGIERAQLNCQHLTVAQGP